MKIHLADIFYFSRESQDQFQYLTYQKKMHYSLFYEYICFILYPIYFEFLVGCGTFVTNWIFSSNFAYITTEKPRASAEYAHKAICIIT